jgi:serine/threonine-protein kinase HipA
MKALEVHLNERRVGVLEKFDEWEHRFSFDESWLSDPNRPVLGQLFEDFKPRDLESTGTAPNWFSHLLPQGPLRREVCRQASLELEDEFELLELLGSDLPGAVVLRPGEPRFASRARREAVIQASGPLRFSLAGAQWKLSVRQGERGLTLPVEGGTGHWIAKFHDPEFTHLPRIEAATTRWAELAKIDVPPFRLANASEFIGLPENLPTGDGAVFLIRRFDRLDDGGRVHMEDFCKVLDRPLGYPQYGAQSEEIAAVLAHLCPEDLKAYCERLVFCVLAGNTDGHLKN